MKDTNVELLPNGKQNTNKINMRPKDESNMIFKSVNRNFSYLLFFTMKTHQTP